MDVASSPDVMQGVDDLDCDYELVEDSEDEKLPTQLGGSGDVGKINSRVLPLPRTAPTPTFTTCPEPVVPLFSSPTVSERKLPADEKDEVNSGGGDDDGEQSPNSDRIGAYFGYNGSDSQVPKPAYDAMMMRVRTLESALGTANRDIRTHTATIADQSSRIQALQQQLQQKELVLKQCVSLEATLRAKERDIELREHALEQMMRQQRRMLKKRSQSSFVQQQQQQQQQHYEEGESHSAQVSNADWHCVQQHDSQLLHPQASPSPHLVDVSAVLGGGPNHAYTLQQQQQQLHRRRLLPTNDMDAPVWANGPVRRLAAMLQEPVGSNAYAISLHSGGGGINNSNRGVVEPSLAHGVGVPRLPHIRELPVGRSHTSLGFA